MKIPVLLLVFANDNHDALPLLETELRQIENDLAEILINSEIITERLENADVNSLFKRLSMLQASHNPMRIFHFSGHAGGTKLLLEDGIVEASGIARFLNLFKDEMGNNPLKLVFLNGCSTQKQVKLLHEKGIPAVIATSRPISDRLAMEFSRKFYEAFLLKAKNLATAFEEAASFIESTTTQSIQIYRGASFSEEDDDMPWGLYIKDGQDRMLKWRFPLSSVPDVTDIPEVNGGVNRIFHALCEHGADNMIYNKGQMQPTFEDKKEALINEFSWLIGVPLQRLFTEELEEHGKERLIRLVDAYTYTTRFVAYILLSQVMDDKSLYKDERLTALFPIKKEQYQSYNYLNLQKVCIELLEEKGKKIFFQEIKKVKQLWEEDMEIAEWFAYMEDFRRIVQTPSLMEKWEEKDMIEYSEKVESIVTELLVQFSFLAKYRLLTVTDIEIHHLRFQPTKFEHFYGELHGIYQSFEGFVGGKMDDYSYSHSVLLVRKGREKELDKPENYLVLSPFIFDNNSYIKLKINEYRSLTPNIFQYVWTEEGSSKKHIFLDINHDSLNPKPDLFKEVLRGNNEQPMLDKVYEQIRVLG